VNKAWGKGGHAAKFFASQKVRRLSIEQAGIKHSSRYSAYEGVELRCRAGSPTACYAVDFCVFFAIS
jgi:hypothetical protein